MICESLQIEDEQRRVSGKRKADTIGCSTKLMSSISKHLAEEPRSSRYTSGHANSCERNEKLLS